MQSIQASGVMIIAAAGNSGLDYIHSDLNNGTTIMVGSHEHSNVISNFSSAKCLADVVALGENFYTKFAKWYVSCNAMRDGCGCQLFVP